MSGIGQGHLYIGFQCMSVNISELSVLFALYVGLPLVAVVVLAALVAVNCLL